MMTQTFLKTITSENSFEFDEVTITKKFQAQQSDLLFYPYWKYYTFS